jgi:uncharacterized protein
MNVGYTNVCNVGHTALALFFIKDNKMNNLEINQHLLKGDIQTKGVLPHLDELPSLPFLFKQDFGLTILPEEPGMIMIRGPRQYGKSTWLEQQIKITIEKFGAGSALYLNGDEILDHVALLDALITLIHLFPSHVKIKRIFIDEMTAISDWQRVIKRLADAGELADILLITTGSKATDLRRGFERLPGRKGKLNRNNYIFTPISYDEFCNKCSHTFGADTLHAYILSGGSAIGANSLAAHGCLAEYVVNTISDWVYGEFSQSGRSRANLMAVLSALYKFAPNPIGQSKLARESGLANNTLAKAYTELLADLMILLPAYPYDINKEISIFRKECKYHFINVFFALCMHPQKPRSIAELKALPAAAFAPILEWIVAQEIWRQSCIANIDLDVLNFWQTEKHEIDFVVPKQKLWIEVKSGSEQVTNFAWFSKQILGDQHLQVINQARFKTKRICGLTLHDFLLSNFFSN